MNILFYHPNLHLNAGGERVMLRLASELNKKHNVTIFSTYPVDIKWLENLHCLDLKGINIVPKGAFIKDFFTLTSCKTSLQLKWVYKYFDKFDYVLDFSTNGHFYKKTKAKTLCYVHFPNFTAKKSGIKSILNPLLIDEKDMFCYDNVVCNSNFTQEFVKGLTSKKTSVVYPPVEIASSLPGKKENMIMTNGRYDPQKKHHILVDAYIKSGLTHKFVIVGALDENDREARMYLALLKEKAKGHNIEFHYNIPHNKVLEITRKTRVYWHARGYGNDDPTEYENFGLTTVEAMGAGCIPVVINLGAQPEIVRHGKDGYCWNTLDELLLYTKKAFRNKTLGKAAYKRSLAFSADKYMKKMIKIIEG